MSAPDIDDLYAEFVRTLPAELGECARALPARLHLAPRADIPWSQVFSHEVTLGAPRLAAEGMPGVAASAVRDATLAHLLAIVEAFGTDRLLDGQIEVSAEIEGVLEHARVTRDEALARVSALSAEVGDDLAYAAADAETAAAIRAEQAVLRGGEGVPWGRYLAVAHGKQRLGLPASLALARAAGWDARRRRALARMLDAIWVGLQLHDDVVDWEDDLARGGAWAASLAAYSPLRIDPHDRKTVPVSTRKLVLESGALHRMLRCSAWCFRAARRRAAALGLTTLARWAAERERTVAALAAAEATSPGRTNRAHALAHWAKDVLGE